MTKPMAKGGSESIVCGRHPVIVENDRNFPHISLYCRCPDPRFRSASSRSALAESAWKTWVQLPTWPGANDLYENPAKVLKESLCEALFCLESGSKLWKAMLVNYQKRYVAIAISWNTISSCMLALIVKCEIVRDTFLAHKCSQR